MTVPELRTAGVSEPGLRHTLFLLCAQVAILHIGQSLVVPILPLYARSFDVTPTVVGVLLAAQAVPRLFANVPAGRLADRIGAHRLLAVALVAALGAAAAPGYFVLLLCRVVQGIGSAISHTAGLTYAASLGGAHRRGRRVSLYQGSFLLGNGIGPVFGGLIAQHLGYRAPFLVYAGIAAVAGYVVLVRLPDPRARGSAEPIADEHEAGMRAGAWSLLLSGGILMACFMALLSAYTRSGSRDFALVLLADARGVVESQIGLALTLIFLANVAVLYLAGALVDRYGPREVLMPGWLLVGSGLTLLAVTQSYSGLLTAAVLYGLGAGIGNAVPAIHIANAVRLEQRGLALGIFRTFSDFGLIVGPLLMGWMAGTVGLAWGVGLNAAVVFVAAVAFLLFGPVVDRCRRRSPLTRRRSIATPMADDQVRRSEEMREKVGG
ncbi:MAG: MFS transporter [Acidimicrobiales bacterium]